MPATLTDSAPGSFAPYSPSNQGGGDVGPPSEPPVIPLWPWAVAKIKRKLQERRAHRRKENPQDRFARRTANATVAIALLTLAIGVVGILQYCTFKGQLDVMQGQLVEMQAARRPWLDVQTTITGPLTFDPAPNFQLKATLTNLGQSAALDVWPNVSMYPDDPTRDAISEIPQRCAKLRKDWLDQTSPHHLGYFLFPTRDVEIPRGATLNEKKGALAPMRVLICGDYRFTFSSEFHTMAILSTLTTNLPAFPGAQRILRPGNWNSLIDPRFGKIDPDHLKLYYEPGDTFSN
jgi:hypothetical protein